MENNHGITETPQPKDPAAVRGGPGQRLYQAEPAGPGLERGRQASVRRRTCGILWRQPPKRADGLAKTQHAGPH